MAPDAVDAEDRAADAALVARLRSGDEAEFAGLVERYHASLVRLASAYVADRTAAEDVAQETWLGVLRGLDRFAGRSSLRTWIFRILVNRAKTRGVRDRRTVPFSALTSRDDGDVEGVATVDGDRFLPDGHWASSPRPWADRPEDRILADEVQAVVARAVAALPTRQRTVIELRDVDGWSAEEVRGVLGLSDGNQRVLLHRARAKVRLAVERYRDDR